jgi:hypothetical protein
MKMPFGKYKGQLVEKIILVHPDYIAWLCRQKRYSKFEFLYKHIDRCIEIFDNKPFSGVRGRGTRPVKYMTFLAGSPTPFFWCDKCDIRKCVPGDVYDRLIVVDTYMDAVDFIKFNTPRTKHMYKILMKHLCTAKGLDGILTKKRVLSFFDDDKI